MNKKLSRNLPWWSEAAVLAYFTCFVVYLEVSFFIQVIPSTEPMPYFRWLFLWPLGVISASLLFPFKFRWVTITAFALLSALITIGDYAYWSFFGTVSSLSMLSSVSQLGDVKHSLFNLITFSSLTPLLFVIPIAAFTIIGSTSKFRIHPKFVERLRLNMRAIWLVAFLAFFTLTAYSANNTPIYENTHHIGREKWVLPEHHWGSKFSNFSYATTFGLFNYHLVNAIEVTTDAWRKPELATNIKNQIEEHLEEKQKLNSTHTELYGIAKNRNIVFVQLESLQNFLIDYEYNGHEVTPFLNTLRTKSLYWDYIFDVTHLGRTSDAEFAIMTGLLPDTRKPAQLGIVSSSFTTLPKTLAEIGYSSYSYHGYKKQFWNRAVAHPAYGIEKMYFKESYPTSSKLGLGASDNAVYSFVAENIANKNQPSFNFIISLSSHHPYIYIPSEFRQPYTDLNKNEFGLTADYLASASYADDALKNFFEKMKQEQQLNNTVFVIYGDHDRGGLGTRNPPPGLDQKIFSAEQDKVIFMIYIPGEEALIQSAASNYRNTHGGLHDLPPTILHLLGTPPVYGMIGTNLLIGNDQRAALSWPGDAYTYIHNGQIISPSFEKITIEDIDTTENKELPIQDVLLDQLISRKIIDHINELPYEKK
ncbi:Lipoteichoic acid synthase 1 [Sinobacterium norvegicum]|uniref:Lipoteichoic acid synthase 1 n=1 Tax=Sinobacterium norvegicum TaxID=1641715 RepID=A0ABM9AIY2_9GAMM|nr:LTA synthase family protein [Sinobacterium norvegicum]CAH0993186.1 Lipoteichoic acid synthase 1 [Sinobacterium norvegicum]